MASRYIGQSPAAKIYACTIPAIAAAMKPGKGLFDAVVQIGEGRKIDMEHPAALEYRKAHRMRIKEPDPIPPTVQNTMGGRAGTAIEGEIRKYWDYTLGQIVDKFGTMPAFASMLQAADKVESIHARRLEADRKTGELISREFVKKNILSLVERVFQRLLAEMPVGLATEVHTMCSTNATLEEVQQAIHDAVSRELKTLKRDTKREIKRAKD